MSRKEIVVTNALRGTSNRLQNWFRLPADLTVILHLRVTTCRINAKSIMGIMAFNPSKGMTVNIVAEGSDEEEALVAMEKFLVCE